MASAPLFALERAESSAKPSPMSPRPAHTRQAVLPHEYGFFVLYALVITRLLLSPGVAAWREVVVWVAFAAASAGLILLTRASNATGTWWLRLGAYLVLMNAAYFRMGAVFAATHGSRRDALLQRADTLLFGNPCHSTSTAWPSRGSAIC